MNAQSRAATFVTMANELDVFERGIHGERRGLLILSVFMLLLGVGGGLYLASDDLRQRRVATAVVKGGLLAIGGAGTLVWARLQTYPGLDVLRDTPGRIVSYTVTPTGTAVSLRLDDARSLRLPLFRPQDVPEAERVIASRAPNVRREG